jgi:hypothetical protein
MSVSLSLMSKDALMTLRAQIDEALATQGGSASNASAPAPKVKKPRANAGLPTLHGDWTSHIASKFGKNSEEFKSFLADRVASAKAGTLLYNAEQAMVKNGKKAVGDAMDEKDACRGAGAAFVAFYRKNHQEEFNSFKSAWDAEHPKGVTASVTESSSEGESEVASGAEEKPKKKRGAKKDVDCTPEELAARKEKRAAKKAAKSAEKAGSEAESRAASVVEAAKPEVKLLEAEAKPEALEEHDDRLMPFTFKKISYLRFGHEEDGEKIWDEGNDLWLATLSGAKGAYAGVLQASGKIDSSPEVLAAEPDVQ